MSTTEVLHVDSNIEYFDPNKGRPSPSDANALLFDRLSQGFFMMMSFSGGRLVDVSNEVGSISPDDARVFDETTMNQLGPPTVNLYRGPWVEKWLWIDGDIRIQYTNRPIGWSHAHDLAGPRSVRLDICVYPEMRRKEPLMETEWGDSSDPIVLKQLPKGIGGLALGSAPWQVRQTFPGIDIYAISTEETRGKLTAAVRSLDVTFWNGHAMKFCEDIQSQFQQYAAIRDQALQSWGTPASRLPVQNGAESIEWDDGQTEIRFFWIKDPGNAGRSFSLCFTDIGLLQLSETSHQPVQFKPAPLTKSFF